MIVVPSLSVLRLSPSNQAAHRESRCPLTRITYRPDSFMTLPSFQALVGADRKARRTGGETASPHVVIHVVIFPIGYRSRVRDSRSSSCARRTAARRLLTPSLA